MSIHNVPRWFSLSDGTLTHQITFYEALNYTQEIAPLGGFEILRMLDGSALKQTNWVKHSVTLSGNGGIPLGMHDLDWAKVITLWCGATRAIVRNTNNFTLPAHRTDTGYEPFVLKYLPSDGLWVPLATNGVASKYMCQYYPILQCLFEPPSESQTFDSDSNVSWTLNGEEI
jgi:hypothetical protein